MTRRLFRLLLTILLLAGGLPAAGLPSLASHPALAEEPRPMVMGVRIAFHDGITRLVLDLTAPIGFSVSSDGPQITVDVPDLEWHGASGLSRSIGVLKDYRYASSPPQSGQLLLQTRVPSTVDKSFLLPPGASPYYRLVVDLIAGHALPPPLPPAKSAAPPSHPAPSPAAAKQAEGLKTTPVSLPVDPAPAPPPAAAEPDSAAEAVPERRQSHGGKPIVAIDPGHGGIDPGATSLSGVYEKVIVLALAREVKARLDKDGKVKCILTRDHDTFVPLRGRVALARAAHADLFMSLHADTVADPSIRGLSVYTLSQTSSDAEAQALADKENKSDIVAGIDLSNESPEVTNILIDLVQRESLNLSAVLASRVISQVQRETHVLLENTHRFAGFAVLKAPDIPSILVETGYLSNEHDEQMLRKPEYRTKLAGALAQAIEQYFARTQKARRR